MCDTKIRAHQSNGARNIRAARENESVTTELQLHSDQGFQYTSHGYFDLLQKYGIRASVPRRGNCIDNTMAENFFGILKAECINRQKTMSFNEERLLIDDYMHFCNHERIQ